MAHELPYIAAIGRVMKLLVAVTTATRSPPASRSPTTAFAAGSSIGRIFSARKRSRQASNCAESCSARGFS